MDRKNYSQIRAELAAANEWLFSLGVREQQDRIRQHMRRIEQLDEALQAGKLVEALRPPNPKTLRCPYPGADRRDVRGALLGNRGGCYRAGVRAI